MGDRVEGQNMRYRGLRAENTELELNEIGSDM